MARNVRLERIRLHHVRNRLIAELDIVLGDLRAAITIGRHNRARRLMRIRHQISAADEYAHRNEHECRRTHPKLALAVIVAGHVKNPPGESKLHAEDVRMPDHSQPTAITA
jgi:hypothetical protein